MRMTVVSRRRTASWNPVAVALTLPSVAHAGPGVWTSGGPNGGMIGALAIDPTHPAALFAGTYAIVPLNGLGELAVRCAQASGTAHFILDVNGYFE